MATSVSVSALPSEKSRDLLNNVREELSRTVTRVDEINKNHEYVLNNALYLKVRELLEEMQIGDLGPTIWRMSNPIRVQNTNTPGYLIPVNVTGTPSVDPGGVLEVGKFIRYTVNMNMTPDGGADCIFAAPRMH